MASRTGVSLEPGRRRPLVRRLLKGVGIGVVLAGVATALILWRLASSPLRVDFLQPSLEQALAGVAPDLSIRFSQTRLSWDRSIPALVLEARDVSLESEDRSVQATFPKIVVGAHVPSLMRKRISPTHLTIFGAQIALTRDEDGRVNLGLASDQAVAPRGSLLGLAGALHREGPGSPIAHLRRVSLADASLVMDDHKLGLTWRARPATLSLERRGEEVHLEFDLTFAFEEKRATVQGALQSSGDFATIDGRASFTGVGPEVVGRFFPSLAAAGLLEMPLAGDVEVEMSESGLEHLAFHVQGERGTLDLSSIGAPTLAVRDFLARGRIDAVAQTLSLDSLTLDLAGTRVEVEGGVDSLRSERAFRVRAHLDSLDVSRVKQWWPEGAATGARRWIRDHLDSGLVHDLAVEVRGAFPRDADQRLRDLHGSFRYADLLVNYFPPMPPAEAVTGTASFDRSGFHFGVAEGTSNELTIEWASVDIDLDRDPERITLTAHIAGPLARASEIGLHQQLIGEPFSLAHQIVGGRVAARLWVDIPTSGGWDAADVDLRAELRDVGLQDFAFDRSLSEGRFSMRLKRNEMSIAGIGRLGDGRLAIEWTEWFDEDSDLRRHVIVRSVLDRRVRTALGLGNLDLRGPIPVLLALEDDTGGDRRLVARLDLQRAALFVPVLGIENPVGTLRDASVMARLEGWRPLSVDELDLEGDALRVKGSARFDSTDGTLRAAVVDVLTAGRTELSAIEIARVDSTFTITINEGTLDLALAIATVREDDAPDSDDSQVPPPGHEASGERDHVDQKPPEARAANSIILRIQSLDRIYLSADEYLQDIAGQLEWVNGQLDRAKLVASFPDTGDAAASPPDLDSPPIQIELTPVGAGHHRVLLRASHAGRLVALAGHDEILGGSFLLHGIRETASDGQPFHGRIELERFRVAGAPRFAKLLGVASLEGLRNLVVGEEGLEFDRLIGDIREQGGVFSTEGIRATGPALGITMKGYYDTRSGEVAIDGTLSPFYSVLGLPGKIPVIGRILSGGKGEGVLVATYEVRGPVDDPTFEIKKRFLLVPPALRKLFDGSGPVPPPDSIATHRDP